MGAEPAVALDFEARDERPRARAREKTVMVSARIPESTYLRVKDILQNLGKSQTDLISAAFEYVLERGVVPEARPYVHRRRKLSESELEAFKQHMRDLQIFHVDGPDHELEYEGLSDKEVLTQALVEKYLGIEGDGE